MVAEGQSLDDRFLRLDVGGAGDVARDVRFRVPRDQRLEQAAHLAHRAHRPPRLDELGRGVEHGLAHLVGGQVHEEGPPGEEHLSLL